MLFLPPATKLGQGNIFKSMCQEFCPQDGACMAGGVHGRGHAWQGACMAGGVCVAGGVHGRGHVWQGGHSCSPPHHQILRDTVNERAVRILLECILFVNVSKVLL